MRRKLAAVAVAAAILLTTDCYGEMVPAFADGARPPVQITKTLPTPAGQHRGSVAPSVASCPRFVEFYGNEPSNNGLDSNGVLYAFGAWHTKGVNDCGSRIAVEDIYDGFTSDNGSVVYARIRWSYQGVDHVLAWNALVTPLMHNPPNGIQYVLSAGFPVGAVWRLEIALTSVGELVFYPCYLNGCNATSLG